MTRNVNYEKLIIPDNWKDTLRTVERFISSHEIDVNDRDLLYSRCLNEAWFSNTLAWLLNPKGSHKLGVNFSNEFLKQVAKIRSSGRKLDNGILYKYNMKQSFLRWGKGGAGTLVNNNFSLKNASAIREFYLSQGVKKNSRGRRYCDIAFIDLDSADNLIAIIENKLFSANHSGQLQDYYDIIEEKFVRVGVREYIYLTLFGNDPVFKGTVEPKKFKNWVRMSWATDIREILTTLKPKNNSTAVEKLLKLLTWFESIQQDNNKLDIDILWQLITSITADCLLDELNRLGGNKTGYWKVVGDTNKRTSLLHTSRPKSPLYIELLPNFSVTIQGHQSGKARFEKIIFPFGANSDQTYNLMDIAARDIFYLHFEDQAPRYLDSKRRLTKTISVKRKKFQDFYSFIAKHDDVLKILFLFCKRVWDAEEVDAL